jgi:hypothetical protein
MNGKCKAGGEVSRLASGPRFSVWRGVHARTAPPLVVVLASASFALCGPASAGLAFNDDRPIIKYSISGIRGTNGWYRGSRAGDYVVLRWTVRDRGAMVIFTSGCRKEIIRGPVPGTTRTCVAWSENGRSSVTTKLIKIDADPPRLAEIVVSSSDGFVSFRWNASEEAHFLISRSPGRGGVPVSVVYRGTRRRFADRTVRSGVGYKYTLTALDQAGNSATRTVRATPRPPLFAPASGVELRSPQSILFMWNTVPQATYYNFQLWFAGERVFSAWPNVARVRLTTPWVYGGVTRYLLVGRYTWYVWPGRGERNQGTYGPLLGSSIFLVTR